MPLSEHHCHTALCDDCGDGWEEGTMHFDSVAELTTYLSGGGWVISPAKVLCRPCARNADCAATGHQWEDWDPRQSGGVTYLSRDCEHCMRSETDPPFAELSGLMHAARTINGITEGDDHA